MADPAPDDPGLAPEEPRVAPEEPQIGWRGRIGEVASRRQVPLATIVTTVGVVVLTGFVLLLAWVLRTELMYILVATFIATLLVPPVRLLTRRGIPHGLACTIVFLMGIVVFAGLVFLFGVPLVSAVTRFSKEVPNLVSQAEHGQGPIGHLVRRFHLEKRIRQEIPKLSNYVGDISKPALSVGAAAASTLLAVVTIAILSFFLLLESSKLWRGFLRQLSEPRARRTARVADEVIRTVTGYMLGNGLTSVMAGIVVMVTLYALDVPYPLLQGLWVALVDLLPLIGGLLAGVPVVVIAFLHSVPAGIVMLVVFLAYQQIENHILNPIVMSKTVRLSPLWVLLAVLVGASLGGRIGSGFGSFVGALIGIPVGGALQVLVREIRRDSGSMTIESTPAATATSTLDTAHHHFHGHGHPHGHEDPVPDRMSDRASEVWHHLREGWRGPRRETPAGPAEPHGGGTDGEPT